jgi:POT family proton-dependent oligopeptide transporter
MNLGIRLEQGIEVSVIWQIFAFVFLSLAELMVFTTGLEIAYVHALNSMKSLFLALYCVSIGLGDLLTAVINYIIQDPNGNPIISGSTYFCFFTGLMAIAQILFIIYMPYYKGKVHLLRRV